MNRRELLAAGALLAAPQLAFAAPRPAIAVFDRRYGESVAWAKAMAAEGARLVGAHEDVARLWYGPLKDQRTSLAGLTTWADFQVIQGCAAEARLRLLHKRRGRLVEWAVS